MLFHQVVDDAALKLSSVEQEERAKAAEVCGRAFFVPAPLSMRP